MRNADYWRGRFSILEDSAHREAQKTIQDMEELYLDAQRSVQKEIESWYARFAVNNQISLKMCIRDRFRPAESPCGNLGSRNQPV